MRFPSARRGCTFSCTFSCHSFALTSDGTVVAWGLNGSGQCSPPRGLTGVTAIAAGVNVGVALFAHPPLFTSHLAGFGTDQSCTISIQELLQGCTDPDGDTFDLTHIDAMSTQEGRTQAVGPSITYFPPSGFTGLDSFTCTVTDATGASSEGTVRVRVASPVGPGPIGLGVTVQATLKGPPRPSSGIEPETIGREKSGKSQSGQNRW